MSADSHNDPQQVLAQLRSTIASLGALRSPTTEATETVSPEPFGASSATAVADANTDDQMTSAATVESVSDECMTAGLGEKTAPTSDDTKPPLVGLTFGGSVDIDGEQISELEDDEISLPRLPEVPEGGSVILRQANKQARIMIIDDESLNVMTFRQHLKQAGYSEFITTSNAKEALGLVRKETPDVVLLDINMPDVNGLDILRVMGLDPSLQHIPVLVLTAATDPEIRAKALDLGASDFLNKPIEPNELLPRVRNAIILKQHFDMVAGETSRLEQQVERRTRQLEATRQQLILSLARAAEHRDNDTGNHVLRVGRYTAIIAEELGYPEKRLSMLEQAAQLHDVGKIGIPDSILFKPGKLDPDEYELIKKHCALGKQIIEPISEKDWSILKTHTRRGESLLHVRSSPLLMLAARIAQTHHEKWDGSGYPLGLSGTDIPLEGRIVAVADVFDALSSARPYKQPFSREQCFEILETGRGKHFDPQILDAFFARADEIIETQLLLMDQEVRVTGEQYTTDDSSVGVE